VAIKTMKLTRFDKLQMSKENKEPIFDEQWGRRGWQVKTWGQAFAHLCMHHILAKPDPNCEACKPTIQRRAGLANHTAMKRGRGGRPPEARLTNKQNPRSDYRRHDNG